MASNAFLVFAGGNAPTTQGESLDKNHPNSIEVTSFIWGAQNAVNLAHTKATATPLSVTITKPVDFSSVRLFQAMLNSSTYGTATLYITKSNGSGGVSTDYLIYTLTSVGVSSIRDFYSNGDGQASEEVMLVFTSAKMSYAKQNNDGSIGTPIVYGWNFATNTPT